jgi:hypothetical protein
VADTDSFVQEVTEEVRRDAMFAAWKKYGPFVVGAIAIVILGTAASAWWTNSQLSAKRAAGGAFIEAQSVEAPNDAAEAFLSLSRESEGDYAAMAGLRAGASFGAAGDVERAVEQYEAVAAMADVDPRLTDLATLRTIMIRADTMEPSAMVDALQPLAMAGEPWRAVALEFTAAAHVRAGETEAAIEALSTLFSDETTTPAVQARAREMIAALGGTAPERPAQTVSLGGENAADDSEAQ